MSKKPSPPKWDTESVLRRLDSEAARPGVPVEAQLFLEESVAPESLGEMVRAALTEEARRQGESPDSISVGTARMMSRSIVARAPVSVLRELMRRDGFKSLLPANYPASDVTVKPVGAWPDGTAEDKKTGGVD